MSSLKSTAAVVGGLLLLVVLAVASWQLGWFVEEKNVNRQVGIDNRNKGAQVAWRDEARNAISDFRLLDPADTANRGALRNKACSLIPRLAGSYRDADLVTFESQECR